MRMRMPELVPPSPTRPAAAIAAATTCLLLGALVSGAATGCSKKDDGPRPAAIGPSGGPGSPAPAPAPSENLPAPTPSPPAAAAGSGTGGTIVGKITLADARRGNVAPSDAVYLVARRVPDHPGARGSLVAVKRFTASSFPIDFTLSAADMMFQNGPFAGDLTLSARVDKDGDPMTRRKGDVFGTLDRVTVGAKGVDVKIDQLQAQDESLGAPPMMGGGMPQGHP
jgi:hypothetical protein